VQGYALELIAPACVPGADMWSARAQLEADISDALPYLNARLERADYQHGPKVLIWKREGRKYAFRPHEIAVAPVQDREEARRVVEDTVALVNEVWAARHEIQPDFEPQRLPSIMEIYRRLPRSNCGECGYPTCMAYAAALREGGTDASSCPHAEDLPG
jgi:ArsR family metal-binding transcriptional regulator